jgi:fatty acid synthase subunit alpha, fungi type
MYSTGTRRGQALKIKDEPIKGLLGNVNSSLIKLLLEHRYGGDEATIPALDYLAVKPPPLDHQLVSSFEIKREESGGVVSYQLGEKLPEVHRWMEYLAGPKLGWLRALICSPTIMQGMLFVDKIRRDY